MQMNSTVVSSNNKKELGCKISTTTIKQQQKFQCRAEEFYNVFTTIEVSPLIPLTTKYLIKCTFSKNT